MVDVRSEVDLASGHQPVFDAFTRVGGGRALTRWSTSRAIGRANLREQERGRRLARSSGR